MTAPFAHIPGVYYPDKGTTSPVKKAPRKIVMTSAEIARARMLVCSLITEIGQMTGALDTIEEIQRNASADQRADETAIAEAAGSARDAAFQIETTLEDELWPLFHKHAEGVA